MVIRDPKKKVVWGKEDWLERAQGKLSGIMEMFPTLIRAADNTFTFDKTHQLYT